MTVSLCHPVLDTGGQEVALHSCRINTYTPSLIVATLVTKYYLKFKGSKAVDAVLAGIKAAVVGLLAGVALTLGRDAMSEPVTIVIGLTSFMLMAFTKVEPTLIIIGAGVAGAALL